jgi:hypothetical protein
MTACARAPCVARTTAACLHAPTGSLFPAHWQELLLSLAMSSGDHDAGTRQQPHTVGKQHHANAAGWHAHTPSNPLPLPPLLLLKTLKPCKHASMGSCSRMPCRSAVRARQPVTHSVPVAHTTQGPLGCNRQCCVRSRLCSLRHKRPQKPCGGRCKTCRKPCIMRTDARPNHCIGHNTSLPDQPAAGATACCYYTCKRAALTTRHEVMAQAWLTAAAGPGRRGFSRVR